MKTLQHFIGIGLLTLGLVACPDPPKSDTTAPTVTITTPNDNSSITTTSIEITGTASDDVAVTSLEYTLNGGTAQPVALANPFIVNVANLVIGKNIVIFSAKDASGNTNKATLNLQYTLGNTPTISGRIVNWNTAPVSTGKIQFETSSRDILGSGNIDTLGNFTATLSIPPASSLYTYAPGAMLSCESGSTATYSNAFKAPGQANLVYSKNDVHIGFASLANSLVDPFEPLVNSPVGTKKAGFIYVDTNVEITGVCINSINPLSQTVWNLNLNVGWNYVNDVRTSTTEQTITHGISSDLQWYFTFLTKILKISKTGAGKGTISSKPDGIDCGTKCSNAFNEGTTVTLTATPTSDSSFTGWSGDCTGTAQCVVTMDVAKDVIATFDTNPVSTALGDSPIISGKINAYSLGAGVIKLGTPGSSGFGTVVTTGSVSATGDFSVQLPGALVMNAYLMPTFQSNNGCNSNQTGNITMQPPYFPSVILYSGIFSSSSSTVQLGNLFFSNLTNNSYPNTTKIIYHVFVDQDSTAVGACNQVGLTQSTNLNLKKGWNTVLFTRIAQSATDVTSSTTTELPSSDMTWRTSGLGYAPFSVPTSLGRN